MARFHFRLKAYERIVQHEREAIGIELANAISELNALNAALNALIDSIKGARIELQERLRLGTSSEEYRMRSEIIDGLEMQQDEILKKIKAQEDIVDAIQGRLKEARLKERVVERLKEKQLEKFNQDELKAIQNELDDLIRPEKE